MMVELLMPLAVFGSFVLVMGQLTRLFSNISLNRTLRDALRSDPASVPLLAERLDARQPWADALTGWIFLAFALGLVVLAMFEPYEDRRDIFQAALVPAIVGLVVLAFVRWARPTDAPAATSRAMPVATIPPLAPGEASAAIPRGRRSVRKPA